MTQVIPENTPFQLLRRKTVEQIVGWSRSQIYREMAAGRFPQPVRLGGRSVAWRLDDIQAFIESREKRVGSEVQS